MSYTPNIVNAPENITMPASLTPGLDATNVKDAIVETYSELSQAMDFQDLTLSLENQLI